MMNLDRRRFLSLLTGAAAASTTAYFLPPSMGWHSDVIAHPGAITLKMLQDAFAKSVHPTLILKPRQIGATRMAIALEMYKHGDFTRDQIARVLEHCV